MPAHLKDGLRLAGTWTSTDWLDMVHKPGGLAVPAGCVGKVCRWAVPMGHVGWLCRRAVQAGCADGPCRRAGPY